MPTTTSLSLTTICAVSDDARCHMGLKVCVVPGCMEPTAGTRCVAHERAYQRDRNTRRGKERWANAPFRKVPIPPGAECACCGTGEDLTRHHVVPFSWVMSGRDVVALPDWCNGFELVALCRRCNSSVADRFMVTRQCPMHGGRVKSLGE